MAAPAWYDSAWAHRVAMTVIAGAGTTADATIVIPTSLEHFWSNVLASGNDVRVTYGDGETLVTYDIAAGFSTTTKTGTIELDNVAVVANSANVFWLYYGNANAADARSAFSPATPVSGYIAQESPTPDRVVSLIQESPDATRPAQVQAKISTETQYVYIDVTDALASRVQPKAGSNGVEGVQSFLPAATAGGVSYGSMCSNSANNLAVESAGRLYLRIAIAAGVSGTDYTVATAIGTMIAGASARTLSSRFLVSVYDVSDV